MTKDQAAAILGIDVNSSYSTARSAYLAQIRLVNPSRFDSENEEDLESSITLTSRLQEALYMFKEENLFEKNIPNHVNTEPNQPDNYVNQSMFSSANSTLSSPSENTAINDNSTGFAESFLAEFIKNWDQQNSGFGQRILQSKTSYNEIMLNRYIRSNTYLKMFLKNYVKTYGYPNFRKVTLEALGPFSDLPLDLFFSDNPVIWYPGNYQTEKLIEAASSLTLKIHITIPYMFNYFKKPNTLLPSGSKVNYEVAEKLKNLANSDYLYKSRPGLAIMYGKLYYQNPYSNIDVEIRRIYNKVNSL